MHPSFAAFRETPLARDLDRLIEGRDRYIAFVAVSRAGLPAVTALVDDLRRRFGDLPDHTARRYVGAKTAEVMRRRGHVVRKARARVPGGYFAYGALFSPEPEAPPAGCEGAWDAFFAQGPAEDFPKRAPQPPTPSRPALDA
jgi:hypothetical protein